MIVFSLVVENVIEAMVDALVVVDVEGRITLANTALARITGYSLEELRDFSITKLLVDDSSGLRTVVRRRIEEGEHLRREQSWLISKSGEKIPVSVTGSPVLNPEGGLQGIVLVARDIRDLQRLLTEKEEEIVRRQRAEDELRAVNASIEEQLDSTRTQLLLAERRSTLGTLAGGVGHELRNIAQIQIAAVDELQIGLASGKDITQLARTVVDDLERVADHITTHGNRLMQLARPGPDHVAPTDLAGIVRDAVAMLKGAGKLRKQKVALELGDAILVSVNRVRIEQILVNLIVNAVDAIGDSCGAITIRVHSDTTRVRCDVIDNGPGIPPEQLEKVFEPFFTTKPPERGTGLGLPVAREIVASYGGTLSVTSTVGTGTTFTFDLPR
ncbi:MAG: two-component system sensor histidine kinase NtrB [Kofleriaceae bacterium]